MSVVAPLLLVSALQTTGALNGIDQIADAWRTQQRRFNTVRFRYSGVVITPSGFLTKPSAPTGPGEGAADLVLIPEEGTSCPVDGEMLLDLVRGRVRVERRSQRPQTAPSGSVMMVGTYEIAAFDGERYRFYLPAEKNRQLETSADGVSPEYWIYDTPRQVLFQVEHDPLLLACGAIYLTNRVDPDKLRVDVKSSLLRVDNDNVLHNGRRCVVLRTTSERQRYFEYWVDAEDPCQIVRFHAYRLDPTPELWRSANIEHRETEWGPVPDHWTATKYSFQTGKPQTYDVKLIEFEANPPVTDADFEIDAPPSTRVYDATRPKGDQYYVVAAAGRPALPVGEFVLQQEKARSRNWLYLCMVGVVGLVVAAIIVMRRREA